MEKYVLILKKYNEKDFELVVIEQYRGGEYNGLPKLYKAIITAQQRNELPLNMGNVFLEGEALEELCGEELEKEKLYDFTLSALGPCWRSKSKVAIA